MGTGHAQSGSRSGQGLTALTFAKKFPALRESVCAISFRSSVQLIEIPEKQFDAFTVTYSGSHGYHALAALIAAAEEIGLERKAAQWPLLMHWQMELPAWREGDCSLENCHRKRQPPAVSPQR